MVFWKGKTRPAGSDIGFADVPLGKRGFPKSEFSLGAPFSTFSTPCED